MRYLCKKAGALLLAAVVLLSAVPALAEGFTVTAVNATINGASSVELSEPSLLTALAFLPDGSQPDYWLVNGQRVENGDFPFALVFEADGNTVIEAVSGSPAGDSFAEAQQEEMLLQAVNASFRLLNKENRPAGESFETFDFGADYVNMASGENCAGGTISARISADEKKKDSIDHWVINGVPHYFSSKVWFITVYDLNRPMTFEVVYKKAADTTQRTEKDPAEIKEVTSLKSQMQFINEKRQPSGKKFKFFDFTEDYTNLATKKLTEGGLFSARVEALIPEGYAISHWEINGIPFHFNIAPRCITVVGLDETTVYEPFFRREAARRSEPVQVEEPVVYEYVYEPVDHDPVNEIRPVVPGASAPTNNQPSSGASAPTNNQPSVIN